MARKRRPNPTSLARRRVAGIRLRIGNQLAGDGLLDEAIEQYERAAGLDGHNADVRVALADAYFAAEMPAKAYQAYRKALAIHPRHADAQFCLGEFFLHDGRPQAALVAMTRATQCDPGRAYYAYRLGELHWLIGNLELARRSIARATELAPDDAFYHFKLGDVLFARGDLGGAVQSYETAVRCSPLDDFYHIRLAATYRRQSLDVPFVLMLERSVTIAPGNAAYRHLLAKRLESMGHHERAQYHRRLAGSLDAYDREIVRRFELRCGDADQ